MLKIFIEKIPVQSIDLVCQSIPTNLIEPLMTFLAKDIESDINVEMKMLWLKGVILYNQAHFSNINMS